MKKKMVVFAALATFVFVMAACGQKNRENKVEDSMVQTETNNQAGTKDDTEINDEKGEVAPEATASPTEELEVSAEPVKKPNLAALITIKGKEYDLLGDFQEVVGSMVKDGQRVGIPEVTRLFDESGKIGESAFPEGADIWAIEGKKDTSFSMEVWNEFLDKRISFIRKTYYVDDMEGLGCVSGLGISSANDVEEKLDLMGFLRLDPIAGEGHSHLPTDIRYDAVFVNGKVLVFSEYEDDLEEMKKKSDSEVNGGILEESFPHMRALGFGRLVTDMFRSCRNYGDLERVAKQADSSVTLEEEILLLFALEDAYTQLEDGKIERFSLVSFGIKGQEKTVRMAYSEYYYDKDWDNNKFSNQ